MRIVILVALAGCSDAALPALQSDAAMPPSPSNPDLTLAAPAADLARAGGPCSGAPLPPRDATWTMAWQNASRTVNVHVPASYDGKTPTPVVLNFHGLTENADLQNTLSKMDDKSDAAGFIAVHPNGVGNSWNAGWCCGQAAQQMVDDVGFVGAILDQLEAELCVDAHRVFAAGMSNGAFLSHRLGCEMSDRIAAIAPVAGVLVLASCAPKRPMPVIGFHGTSDALVPYNGSTLESFASAPDTYAGWAARDGCGTTTMQTYNNQDSSCVTYQNCPTNVDVTFCTVQKGGHTWPGGSSTGGFGYTTPYLSATDAMWTFFTAHPLP
jgi:polyhydroxybutyrate depolymerase